MAPPCAHTHRWPAACAARSRGGKLALAGGDRWSPGALLMRDQLERRADRKMEQGKMLHGVLHGGMLASRRTSQPPRRRPTHLPQCGYIPPDTGAMQPDTLADLARLRLGADSLQKAGAILCKLVVSLADAGPTQPRGGQQAKGRWGQSRRRRDRRRPRRPVDRPPEHPPYVSQVGFACGDAELAASALRDLQPPGPAGLADVVNWCASPPAPAAACPSSSYTAASHATLTALAPTPAAAA